jgi:hypothetical protein
MTEKAITRHSRFLQNPRSGQSRGFQPKSNHKSNHANHAIRKTAGQAITRAITPITQRAITFVCTPLRGAHTNKDSD